MNIRMLNVKSIWDIVIMLVVEVLGRLELQNIDLIEFWR